MYPDGQLRPPKRVKGCMTLTRLPFVSGFGTQRHYRQIQCRSNCTLSCVSLTYVQALCSCTPSPPKRGIDQPFPKDIDTNCESCAWRCCIGEIINDCRSSNRRLQAGNPNPSASKRTFSPFSIAEFQWLATYCRCSCDFHTNVLGSRCCSSLAHDRLFPLFHKRESWLLRSSLKPRRFISEGYCPGP
ncbi:hypothetical protein ARMGADRAFT_457441 [Armillaria gallica]|uniref:Uncharacterized protein n=1 Tax=Armillaria gallica TaxID=47427 RepID=A0A2H3D9I5_ARMGA|nr:hypothetical protein ARMGADRAFT_457441 [Armillaria gallica]